MSNPSSDHPRRESQVDRDIARSLELAQTGDPPDQRPSRVQDPGWANGGRFSVADQAQIQQFAAMAAAALVIGAVASACFAFTLRERAEPEPSNVPAAPTSQLPDTGDGSPADPDRFLCEAIIRRRGVCVIQADGQRLTPLSVEKIPRGKLALIEILLLPSDPGVEFWKQFARLPSLRMLNLDCRLESANAIAAIGECATLESLEIGGPTAQMLDDDQLARLAGLRQLRNLAVAKSKLTDASANVLGGFRRLKFLELNETAMGDRSVVEISRLTELESLGLGGTSISDAALADVARLTKLRVLDLSAASVSANGLAQLSPLRKLQVLGLKETKLGDDVIPVLRALEMLSSVDLSGTQVTNAVLTPLGQSRRESREEFFKRLDQVFQGVMFLSSLERELDWGVDLRRTQVSLDAIIEHYRSGTDDRWYRIDPEVAGKNRELQAAIWSLNQQHPLWINGSEQMGVSAFLKIVEGGSLTGIGMLTPRVPGDSSEVDAARAYLGELPNLRKLSITNRTEMVRGTSNVLLHEIDQDLGFLAFLPHLESLVLDLSHLSTEDMRPLVQLSALRELSLNRTVVSFKELSELSFWPRLKRLQLEDVPDIAALRSAAALESLDIGGDAVRDSDLRLLAELKPLRLLAISSANQTTAAGRKAFQEARPDCTLRRGRSSAPSPETSP